MSSFLKYLLIYYFVIVSFVHCDDSMELTCTSNNDCTSFTDKTVDSDCREGKCTCWVRKSENGEEIVPCIPRSGTKILGERSRTCPCNLPHTQCVGGFCKCAEGFIQFSESDKCIPERVMLGKSCEIDSQCKENEHLSECIDKVCKCSKKFTEVGNECRSMVNRGKSTCHEISECHEHEECTGGKCVCMKKFVASENLKGEGKCIPYAFFDDKCIENIQCEMGLGVGSICDKEKCICNKNHTQFTIGDKIICHRQIYYKDKCNNHNECVSYGKPTTMKCQNHLCVCADGYELFDAYTKKCVKITLKSSSDNAKSLHVFSILALIYLIALFLR